MTKRVWVSTALVATMTVCVMAAGADANCGSCPASSAACATSGHNHAAGASCSTQTTDYTVRRGESLSRIAQQQLGATSKWRAIARANNLRAPYLIRPGQVIKLPCVPGSAACNAQAGSPNSAGYAAAASNGQAPTLRQLWERPVPSGKPQDNNPQGAELNREWNSRNNVLATGIADRIGPPPATQTTAAPAAPLQAPLGSAAPVPFGSGPVPAVPAVTTGNPVQARPLPPVVEYIENRP